jgi:hypothetical protein
MVACPTGSAPGEVEEHLFLATCCTVTLMRALVWEHGQVLDLDSRSERHLGRLDLPWWRRFAPTLRAR